MISFYVLIWLISMATGAFFVYQNLYLYLHLNMVCTTLVILVCIMHYIRTMKH